MPTSKHSPGIITSPFCCGQRTKTSSASHIVSPFGISSFVFVPMRSVGVVVKHFSSSSVGVASALLASAVYLFLRVNWFIVQTFEDTAKRERTIRVAPHSTMQLIKKGDSRKKGREKERESSRRNRYWAMFYHIFVVSNWNLWQFDVIKWVGSCLPFVYTDVSPIEMRQNKADIVLRAERWVLTHPSPTGHNGQT